MQNDFTYPSSKPSIPCIAFKKKLVSGLNHPERLVPFSQDLDWNDTPC